MPLPPKADGGYKGVDIKVTKLGYAVVTMSHNKHRFDSQALAKAFIDERLSSAREASERNFSNAVQRNLPKGQGASGKSLMSA